jgi:hypothetical protein
MVNSLEEEIKAIKDNLNVLPHNNNKTLLKYNEYIEENQKKYTEQLNLVKEEITKRYNKIENIKVNNDIEKLNENNLDFDFLQTLNERVSSYAKMNLDVLLYRLHYFYKDNLDEVNNVLKEILIKFKEVGIKLTSNDFTYSNYVNSYMKVFFNSMSDSNLLHKSFESLYWECPDLITQIELNFKSLYLRNEKIINKYYIDKSSNSKKTDYYINEYLKNKELLNTLLHTDHNYLMSSLLHKELNIMDYNDVNIDKINKKLIQNKDSDSNYQNLLKLKASLMEYNNYLNYQYIIEDIKKLYTDKNTYKGKYESILKNISKKEKELFGLNSKLNKTGLFALKDNKKGEVKLKINAIIIELSQLYKDLDDNTMTDYIYKYITDESTYYDILLSTSDHYYYLATLLKLNDEKITIEEINENINNLKKYLFESELSIINNVRIKEEKNISQIIIDHYKLLNLNLVDDDLLKDNITLTIKNVNTLITNYDLINSKVDLKKVSFALNVEKEIMGKK